MNQIGLKRKRIQCRRRNHQSFKLHCRKQRRKQLKKQRIRSQINRRRLAALGGRSSEESVIYVGTTNRYANVSVIDLTKSTTNILETKKTNKIPPKTLSLVDYKLNGSNEKAGILHAEYEYMSEKLSPEKC
nr:PREDICTED: uncharacterized protein LOC103313282 [Tribolium castaneum]|eukprot:XP_008194408.1 PREDICTED: uncharacterized protein LOC103313282 [Tribolium castaneum]